jgi:hypothetical protein
MRSLTLIILVLFSVSCAKSQTQDYGKYRLSVDSAKKSLYALYLKSTKKDTVLNLASKYLESQLSDGFYSYWKNTKWDFNGYTDTPKVGYIACGYYVSTNLKHLGFNINRYKMAQQSSESEVKTLDSSPEKVYGTSAEFIEYVKKNVTDGLYILGMTSHVGMIQKKGDEIYFLHSSPIDRMGVIKEKAEESQVLGWSDVFVLGKISNNKTLVKKWLIGEKVEIVLD